VGQWFRTTGSGLEEAAVDHAHHTGMWVPPAPPTWANTFRIHLDGSSVLAVVSLLALLAYVIGVARLRRSGVAWPWWRTLSFVAGSVSLFGITGTWLNGYSMVLFSTHMAQHMVLSMIAPLLLLCGSPITLALRTLPRGKGTAGVPRALLLDVLHSRVARVVTHPGFTLPLFLASLYGVYFTPLFDALMGNPAGHEFMLAHFLVTGLLFFGPILGQDPWPRRVGHGGRMLELLVPMPFHAFFGVAIMMAGTLITQTFAHPPAGWGVDPLSDQTTAGSIAWSFGELPTVLILVIVLGSWMRSEDRRGRQLDRLADRTGNAELEAYNARLRALAARSEH
jgi:cytochrome c oxidase assembly factor CtaG